jgi:hypothetical protein
MKQLMDGEGLTLAAAVNHQLPARGIVTRLGGHRTCDQCQAIFYLTERPRKTGRPLRSLCRASVSERR